MDAARAHRPPQCRNLGAPKVSCFQVGLRTREQKLGFRVFRLPACAVAAWKTCSRLPLRGQRRNLTGFPYVRREAGS